MKQSTKDFFSELPAVILSAIFAGSVGGLVIFGIAKLILKL